MSDDKLNEQSKQLEAPSGAQVGDDLPNEVVAETVDEDTDVVAPDQAFKEAAYSATMRAVVMGEGGGWEDELCCAASRTGFTN